MNEVGHDLEHVRWIEWQRLNKVRNQVFYMETRRDNNFPLGYMIAGSMVGFGLGMLFSVLF